MLEFTHDPEADAMFFLFVDKPHSVCRELDDHRILDYAEDGTLRGVELLGVSHGVDLANLPHADEIGPVLETQGVRIYA